MLRAVAVAIVVLAMFLGVYALDIAQQGFLTMIIYGMTHDYGWVTWLMWYLGAGIIALPIFYPIIAYRWARGL